MLRKSKAAVVLAACLVLAAALPATAIDLESFEKNITVTTLDNGLTILVYERPTAPVVSFFTHVDVGSAQEVPGITGLAHMFEHMAFKGTSRLGTKNYNAEKKALAEVDQTYLAFQAERMKINADSEKLAELETAFKDAQEKASDLVENNEFSEIIDREGGVGLNAFTNTDTTGYFFSLPANKVELWAYLESERFLDPVFREFYKERDVVQEERRMRTESQPVGRMIEQFLSVAFQAHPYGTMVVGHMSDLQSFTRQDAAEFYKKYYVPSNITISVVGDVQSKKLVPMLKKYFSRLPAGPETPTLRTVEPPQIAEKSISIPDPSQPIYVEGYHRPSMFHADDAVYDAISDILSSGRTSRLYRNLVRDKKIAAGAGAFSGFPGVKYPHLMLFFGFTTPGHTNEEIQGEIRVEIERLKSEPVSDAELKMVKTRAKANLIRGLASNGGIAGQLATYQGQHGDWRELFRSVERIEKVTKEDIMRVAQETFVATNRTVAMIVNEDNAAEAGN
ncbi:MAG: insulinase family protein [bacterium]|nr:insulinase family protein [bacterium]